MQKNFTISMMEVIRPKIVIALAGESFNTLWHGCVDKEEVTPNSFKYGNAKMFHLPHPVARINNQKKEEGWFAMKRYLEKYENV